MRQDVAYLSLIVGPRAELHETRLLIERKIGDVDLAGAAKSRRWSPEHVPVTMNHHVSGHVARREVVRAET